MNSRWIDRMSEVACAALALAGAAGCASPVSLYDQDSDGFMVWADCNDLDPGIGARYLDLDGDLHGAGDPQAGCGLEGDGYVSAGDDCDDAEARVYSGAEEVCDGLDNDCDGGRDEGLLDPSANASLETLGDAVDSNCNGHADMVETIAGNGSCCYSGDDGPALAASLGQPGGLALDVTSGYLYVADPEQNRVRRIDPLGVITTVVGTGGAGLQGEGGPATDALLNAPGGVAVDADGLLYVADTGNSRVVQVTPEGNLVTLAGPLEASDEPLEPNVATTLSAPMGIALGTDSAGGAILLIADTGNHRIAKLQSNGTLATIAGEFGIEGYDGDGEAGADAHLSYPHAVSIDADKNIYIADTGNNCIRKLDGTGSDIRTIAGDGRQEAGYAGDGGIATGALLDAPRSISVGAGGRLFIADSGNNRIRWLELDSATGSAPVIRTAVGNGQSGFSGDGGPALDSTLDVPLGLALDGSGNLLFADEGNHRIRKVWW